MKASDEGEAYHMFGTLALPKATGDETGGAFFRDVGTPTTDLSVPSEGPDDAELARLDSVLGKYDVDILGPPPFGVEERTSRETGERAARDAVSRSHTGR